MNQQASNEIFLASKNKKKIEELARYLGRQWKVKMASSLYPEIHWQENGVTFVANAWEKALAVKLYTHKAVVADDSGLAVAALGDQPGVYSSRFSGVEGDDAANNKKLLQMMAKIGDGQRQAMFHCCIVFMPPSSKKGQIFYGRCHGRIGRHPSGKQGFGYDCLFIPDGYEKTFAEIGLEEKQKLSHRGKALASMVNFLNRE